MPDRTTLNIGDRIRLHFVPTQDLEQRERERRKGTECPGWTADTIERILLQDPVVTISSIDEHGYPWFDYDLRMPDGRVEHHSLAIMDNESWVQLP
jgi:hypothetical protein